MRVMAQTGRLTPCERSYAFRAPPKESETCRNGRKCTGNVRDKLSAQTITCIAFLSIHSNGQMVENVKGDNYKINKKNLFEYVNENSLYSVMGDRRIYIKENDYLELYGSQFISIDGNKIEEIGGDYELNIGYQLFTLNFKTYDPENPMTLQKLLLLIHPGNEKNSSQRVLICLFD